MLCNICPRRCKVNRDENIGFCGEQTLRVSKVMLHHYEEPIISGSESGIGSGAIFFTGCNLKCVFCQNDPISHNGLGEKISVDGLVEIMKDLERQGAWNINLVTPTHFTREIMMALDKYRPNIPIVWNSSGYEDPAMVEKLRDYVDIYLVDLKYMDNELSSRYSGAKDYVENATKSILKMRANQPLDIIENGRMKKGVIIRHLILPSHTIDSIRCIDFIADNFGRDTIVSIMSQYEPRYNAVQFSEINRKITPLEYKRVVSHALNRGLNNAYIQDLSSADSKYTPDFNT
ncbi:MAG: radical SAM protein [Clostridia bacterium]